MATTSTSLFCHFSLQHAHWWVCHGLSLPPCVQSRTSEVSSANQKLKPRVNDRRCLVLGMHWWWNSSLCHFRCRVLCKCSSSRLCSIYITMGLSKACVMERHLKIAISKIYIHTYKYFHSLHWSVLLKLLILQPVNCFTSFTVDRCFQSQLTLHVILKLIFHNIVSMH